MSEDEEHLEFFLAPDYFKCANGHMVSAFDEQGRVVNLSLHICPVCQGKIKHEEDALTFPMVLSPIQ